MKVNKKIFCGLCAILVGMTSASMRQVEGNTTLSELESQRNSLAQKTADAKKELVDLENKQLTVLEEIDAMDKVLRGLENELSNSQTELTVIAENLKQSEVDLENAVIAKDDHNEVLGSRLRFLQQKGSTGYMEILLEAETFADLFLRMQYVNDIMLFDKDLMAQLEELQADIEEVKASIELALEAQEVVVELEKEKVGEMNEMIGSKQTLIATYKADETKYSDLIAANEAADKGIIDLINAEVARVNAENAANAANNPNNEGGTATVQDNTVYYTGSGNLGWPVPSKAAATSSLSSGYVNRTNPITGNYESHKGYDIPASYGSAIVAAEAGTVIHSGWMNGYGNTIVIDHGGGLNTLYAHNSSLTVAKGAKVSRGQTVAKCGSTGMSTGNHLHFSVLVNGSYQNPESYLGVKNTGS